MLSLVSNLNCVNCVLNPNYLEKNFDEKPSRVPLKVKLNYDLLVISGVWIMNTMHASISANY